jgi:hypothetical protein
MASLAGEAGDFVHLANTPQTPPPREELRPKDWKISCLFSMWASQCSRRKPAQTLDGGINGKTKLKL